MDKFPDDFRAEKYQGMLADRKDAYAVSQQDLLKRVRANIVSNVEGRAASGAAEVLIQVPDDLCEEMTLELAKELFVRFKGHIQYHCIINYADVDEFRSMTEPRASFEYKIIF